MRATSLTLAAATVLAFSGGACAIAAQPLQIAPGVFADPSSPAAKQYVLQLQQARDSGSAPSPRNGSGHPSLFGTGIAAAAPQKAVAPQIPAATGRSGSTAGEPRRHRGSPGSVSASGGAAGSPGHLAPGSGASTATPGGDAGTVALVGGASAILLLGGLGGVLVRRRAGAAK